MITRHVKAGQARQPAKKRAGQIRISNPPTRYGSARLTCQPFFLMFKNKK